MTAAALAFWVLAVLAVAGAIGVVTMRQPVHSALCLLASFMAVAGLFVWGRAEFLAAVQILVYAGGVMVLFLFTIMLVNVRRQAREAALNRLTGSAVLVGVLLFALVGGLLVAEARRMGGPEGAPAASAARLSTTVVEAAGKAPVEVKGNSQAVAWSLYRDYLLPFEIASVFLLVAMIGAVVLGKRTMEKFD
ncbi:NADH-quinone oxidoreductase subunit J [Acidobacteria bacterium ACD]|nr:MAG: NADH-quinone oxidoreductase subunit J [Acidobacteriota bacterium]MCE7957531.1 NADH-quinone oxidoreductase subunit J [Acidobacteria bacterium ACB2]MDL1948315.1 NADH-quinone oxidoreductase subunit J [Acidobacteria bacterium ACD]